MKKAKTDPSKAIITPRVDMLCGGGISLIVSLLVIIFVRSTNNPVGQISLFFQYYILVDVLINGPHFMASYRVLYSKPQNFRKHPIVTMALPVLFLGFIGYVTYQCFFHPNSPELAKQFRVLDIAAPILLGWHWVGQSWGTTASFSYLSGFRMDAVERRLICCGFHSLFVFNCFLALESMGYLQQLFPNEAGVYVMKAVLSALRVGVLVCFFLGIWGFIRMAGRHQRSVPMRVWIPWLATFSWYVMVDVHASSLILVQGFHALQYLIFPARVEMNEHVPAKQRRWSHMSVYYIVLVITGVIGFHWADMVGWVRVGGVSEAFMPISMATFITLNLHHYFTDAVIWKIRDPEVRKSIFGHLEPSAT